VKPAAGLFVLCRAREERSYRGLMKRKGDMTEWEEASIDQRQL